MSNLCIIEGCPGNTRRKKRGEKVYFFRALEDQLEEWSRVIPGDRKLKIHDRVCSRHFRDEDLIKEWNFVIEDKTVTLPRGRWTLNVGAVPEKFDNYGGDIRVNLRRKSKPKSLVDFGGSSSDEVYDEPPRKRVRKLKKDRSSKLVKKRVPKTSKNCENDSTSCQRPSGNPSKENCGISANQVDEVSWEKACDNFVDQLSIICAQTPSDKPDAKPAKRRGRPRKAERRSSVGRPRKDERRPSVGRPRKDERRSGVGRPRNDERRASVGRPRKDERRSSVGRPPKDKWRSRLVSRTLPSHKRSSRMKRKNSSTRERISGMESENSVIVEEFLASSCADTIDVESSNDPDSSSQITITECIMPSNFAVKTEEDDVGYERSNSTASNRMDGCSITSSSEESTSRQGQRVQEISWNYEGVEVKRESCDCEGDPRCCEPKKNCVQTVLELPATPEPWEEIIRPLDEQVEEIDRGISTCQETENDPNGRTETEIPEVSIISVSGLVHEIPKFQRATSVADLEIIPNPYSKGRELSAQVSALDNLHEGSVVSESQIEALDLTTQCRLSRALTPNRKLGCEELALQKKVPETNFEEKQLEASNNQQPVQKSSDLELNFKGFSSEEEENLVVRRKQYLNTAEMAEKSSKFYFSKLAKACKSEATSRLSESDGLSPRTRRRVEHARRSSAEIAMDQLVELDSMPSVRSKKLAHRKRNAASTVRRVQEPSVQDGKVTNKSNSLTRSLAPDSKCDEAVKCDRVSNEVTKASNLNQRLNNVQSVSNPGQGSDKVTSSSNHVLLADKSNLKTDSFAQSSKGDLISNKVPTSNDRLKGKATTSSNRDMLKNKVTTSLNPHSLKDKVTMSLNHELSKNKRTSMVDNGLMKEKIPITNSAPVADRLSHLLYGSSLDRIMESAKGISQLDSVTSTSICDPTVDKTSQILKNFKSDGVLALECVVLKEQVRQLQKELYLHKQMLIDSEHNVALLQRKLELQAQLPCTKCVNFKRGFYGKETLI